MSRAKPPRSLAEKVAAPGHACRLPATHDRVDECHYWWHEMARNYHEPTPFRYSLGAFIQAARSVTFMLQSEKHVFQDFSWYGEWVNSAKDSELLRLLADKRTTVVHRAALDTSSWIELRCLRVVGVDVLDDMEDVARYAMRPFECTHSLIRGYDDFVLNMGGEDHPHEIVRHWELDDLPGRELQDAAAEIHDRLSEVNAVAHELTGSSLAGNWEDGERPLPCMRDTRKHRVARIERRAGVPVWLDEPRGLHA